MAVARRVWQERERGWGNHNSLSPRLLTPLGSLLFGGRRAPRPEAHAPARQPLVAGSLMPALEDPQDSLQIPANLAPRKVPADARPLLLYADSEGEEGQAGEGAEPEPSELEDWWAEQRDDDELAAGYERDSSSLTDDSDGSGSGGGEDELDAEEAQALAAAAAGLDEATRRLLLQSIAGGASERGSWADV